MGHFKRVASFIALFCVSASLQSSPTVQLNWSKEIIRSYDERLNANNYEDVFVDKDKHIFSALQCSYSKSSGTRECDMHIVTHHLNDHQDKKICKIQPPEGNVKQIRDLRILRADRIMIQWGAQHVANPYSNRGWQYHIQLINPTDCSKTGYYRRTLRNGGDDRNPNMKYVGHDNTLDVVFLPEKTGADEKPICGSASHCKVTLDYDLNKLSDEPQPLINSRVYRLDEVFPIKIDNKQEFFLVGLADSDNYGHDIYTPVSQWNNDHFSGADAEHLSKIIAYSDVNGYATICWQNERKSMKCKSLDKSRPHDTFSIKFTGGLNSIDEKHFPAIYNMPDGDVALVSVGRDKNNRNKHKILIEKFNTEGKCKTLATIDTDKSFKNAILTKFSISKNGNWCASVVAFKCSNKEDTRPCGNDKEASYEYQFSTTCIEPQHSPDQEYHECSQNFQRYY